MKKTAALALLALSATLAQGQGIVLNHKVDAAHRLPGQQWTGSSQSGASTHYHVAHGGSSATVTGGATFGLLSGQGSAVADSLGPQTVASAMAWVDDDSVYDSLTIHSGSLPLGAPVTLEVTLDLWSQQVNGGVDMGVSAWVLCGFSKPGFITIQTEGAVHQSQTGGCNATVGQTLELRGVLYGRVSASAAGGDVRSGSFKAWASYSVRMVTEGASFSSASGALYLPQPVPEPAGAVLLLGGLAALGLWRRRARRD